MSIVNTSLFRTVNCYSNTNPMMIIMACIELLHTYILLGITCSPGPKSGDGENRISAKDSPRISSQSCDFQQWSELCLFLKRHSDLNPRSKFIPSERLRVRYERCISHAVAGLCQSRHGYSTNIENFDRWLVALSQFWLLVSDS